MTSLPSDQRSPQGKTEIAEFIDQLKARQPQGSGSSSGRGRLIFALDATASRAPTWDAACQIQGEMFNATATLGGLDTRWWVGRWDYLGAVARGEMRRNLDGSPAGVPSEDQQQDAAAKLDVARERFGPWVDKLIAKTGASAAAA